MWQSGTMAHGPNNPWMKLMGIVHSRPGSHGAATGDKQDA